MAREALLHIGMHKTGSTSIQRTFDGYVDDNWRYLDLGPPNHSGALAMAFLNNPPERFLRGADPKQKRREMRRLLTEQIKLDRRSVILSGEDLSFYPEQSVVRILKFLSRHVDRVRLICYLREPTASVASSFQELLKRRLPETDHTLRFPRYKKRCAPWLQHVGAENCQFVLFDRTALKDGDLLKDFAARVGISEQFAVDLAFSANEGMSAELAALIFGVRLHAQESGQVVNQTAIRVLLRDLAKFGTGKLAFTPDSLKSAFEQNADQVSWAEQAMNRRFPEPSLSGRIHFDSSQDLLELARSLGPQLAESCRKARLRIPGNLREAPVETLAAWVCRETVD